MSSPKNIASDVNEVWTKLNGRWQGEDANAFYQQYIIKIHESAEYFERACSDLDNASFKLKKELQTIEQSFANQ